MISLFESHKLNGSLEAAAFSLRYATTPTKNDEGPRFRQPFATSFAWRKSWGTFARHTDGLAAILPSLRAASFS